MIVLTLTLALTAIWAALRDPLNGSLRAMTTQRYGLLALGSLGVLLFLAAMGFAPQLGHASSRAYIDEQLGRVLPGTRCVLHAPRELPLDSAERLLDDCEFSVAQAEQGLGVTATQPVHAFFYRSMEEKRRLMGAGATFIAKPWRDEVHLQLGGWPHPVLAHEVVHAVARYASRGPFAVSGTLGGWFPNPGLIEGVAVAIAWDDRDGLTPDEWSAALLALDEFEVAEAFEVPLAFLMDPAHHQRHEFEFAGVQRRFLSMPWEGPGADGQVRRYFI